MAVASQITKLLAIRAYYVVVGIHWWYIGFIGSRVGCKIEEVVLAVESWNIPIRISFWYVWSNGIGVLIYGAQTG